MPRTCERTQRNVLDHWDTCNHCGKKLDDGRHPKLDLEELTVTIRFGQSSSKYYDDAKEKAEGAPFHEPPSEESNLHKVIFDAFSLNEAESLWDLVSGWSSSSMYINGAEATKQDLAYYGVGCFRKMLSSGDGRQFCFGTQWQRFNIWGCIRLDMPVTHTARGWLTYGSVDDDGNWRFDKERIWEELKAEIEENEYCPLLSREKVREAVEMLPDKIDPSETPVWFSSGEVPPWGDNAFEEAYEEAEPDGVLVDLTKVVRFSVGQYTPTPPKTNAEIIDDQTLQIEFGPDGADIPKDQ